MYLDDFLRYSHDYHFISIKVLKKINKLIFKKNSFDINFFYLEL
jgi:hypothetical protein